MKKTIRILIGLLLTSSMALSAFALGTYIAAACCVPADSGLAGPAIVLGYGLMGGGIGALLGLALAVFLPPRWLTGVTIPMALIGSVLLAITVKAWLDARARSQAHLEQAYERLPQFRVKLVHREAAPRPPFQLIEFDWSQRHYRVVADGQTCRVSLPGEQAVRLLGALRDVEAVMLQDPFPCAGTLGEVRHELTFFIPEALPPDTQGRLALTAACLQQHPALAEPLEVTADIHRDNRQGRHCE